MKFLICLFNAYIVTIFQFYPDGPAISDETTKYPLYGLFKAKYLHNSILAKTNEFEDAIFKI